MTKEERKAYKKAYAKAYYQANQDELKAKMKVYREANKEQYKACQKAWYESHREEMKAYHQAHLEERKAYMKAYSKSDVNSLGQTKQSIRMKSLRILKKMNLHIDGYEIHHCFGYEDPSKFIYCSKEMHRLIHAYLRQHNIDADSDHWMAIRELVNSTDEFWYIKS